MLAISHRFFPPIGPSSLWMSYQCSCYFIPRTLTFFDQSSRFRMSHWWMSWPVEYSGIRCYMELQEEQSFLPWNFKRFKISMGRRVRTVRRSKQVQLSTMSVLMPWCKRSHGLQNQEIKKERYFWFPKYTTGTACCISQKIKRILQEAKENKNMTKNLFYLGIVIRFLHRFCNRIDQISFKIK